MEVDGGQVKLFLGMISRKRGYAADLLFILKGDKAVEMVAFFIICLLYTSDAADE